VDAILAELEVCFQERNLKVGELPFEEGQGWREAGIPSTMIIRFCERQTENHGSPTSCCIFHNNCKIYEYRPEKAIHRVAFAAQGRSLLFLQEGH